MKQNQARASGDFVRARATYQNVLRIDSENQSARGDYKRLGLSKLKRSLWNKRATFLLVSACETILRPLKMQGLPQSGNIRR